MATDNGVWTSDNTVTIGDPNCLPNGTSAGDLFIGGNGDILVSDGTGIGEWTIASGNQATVQIGAMTLTASENGDVEIVMDQDGLREEYHINADKVRNFLRSIADVVVEGRET